MSPLLSHNLYLFLKQIPEKMICEFDIRPRRPSWEVGGEGKGRGGIPFGPGYYFFFRGRGGRGGDDEVVGIRIGHLGEDHVEPPFVDCGVVSRETEEGDCVD